MYFFALVATSFDHYGHHQLNIVQKILKGLLRVGQKNVKLYGITFALVSVFINSFRNFNGCKCVRI